MATIQQQETAQSTVGTIVGMTPLGTTTKLISRITTGVTIALVIVLLIIAIALFSNKKITAGVWVLGAGIAIGSFYVYTSRDLCAGTARIFGMGETIDQTIDHAPIEKLDPNDFDNLDDFKPNDWSEFDKYKQE
jgi:hypothetical protein